MECPERLKVREVHRQEGRHPEAHRLEGQDVKARHRELVEISAVFGQSRRTTSS